MYNFIIGIIFLISICGMGIILFRKIPVLIDLPVVIEEQQEKLFLRIKKRVKGFNFFEILDLKNFLKKFLFKIHSLILKTKNKTSCLLKKSCKKDKSKKDLSFVCTEQEDNYWQELKKAKNPENHKSKLKQRKLKTKSKNKQKKPR